MVNVNTPTARYRIAHNLEKTLRIGSDSYLHRRDCGMSSKIGRQPSQCVPKKKEIVGRFAQAHRRTRFVLPVAWTVNTALEPVLVGPVSWTTALRPSVANDE
jgi:hypothetical protein